MSAEFLCRLTLDIKCTKEELVELIADASILATKLEKEGETK